GLELHRAKVPAENGKEPGSIFRLRLSCPPGPHHRIGSRPAPGAPGYWAVQLARTLTPSLPMSTPGNKSLVRSFGLKMAIIIVMSAIIGSGVFKKVAPMAEYLHAPWLVVLAWLLAGIIVLFGVFCISELAALFPDSGGPFKWLEEVYGRPISFLYGWSCFTVIQTAAISSIAFVFAGALNTFIALPRLPTDYETWSLLGLQPLDNIGAKVISCVLIIALTWVNIRGAKKSGHLSLVFTFIIVTAIFAVVARAFGSAAGSVATFTTLASSRP